MDASLLRNLLLAVLALPFVGAIIVLLLKRAPFVRAGAVVLSLIHLIVTAAVLVPTVEKINNRDIAAGQIFQPEVVPFPVYDASGAIVNEHRTSVNLLALSPVPILSSADGFSPAVQFFIGLDGINIWLVALSSVMMLPVVLMSYGITHKPNQFFAWLFLLQGATIGVFLSFDIVLFYVFFELTLIPVFFLIGVWGIGSNKRESATKLFLYTLAGSLLTLVGIVGIVLTAYARTKLLTFSIPDLAAQLKTLFATVDPADRAYWANVQFYCFIALVAGFAVKIPLVPFHTWLPSAYAEAPASVTVMLSALLAKMGTFGLVRILLPLTPDATLSLGLPVIGTLASIGIIYAAMCAFRQTEIKRMIAYSSVSHLGFCVLAIVAFNAEGLSGGILHMVNHGLSTGAIFLLVGLMVDRYGTHPMGRYSGLWNRLPVFTFFMILMCLASVGLPGLNNFVSEMLMLGSLFNLRNPASPGLIFAVVAGFGIFLSAWYILTMLQRVFFGPLQESDTQSPVADLNFRELSAIVPLTLFCFILGLFPQPILKPINHDIAPLTQLADEARARQSTN